MSPSFFPAASLYAAVEHSPVGTLFFNQSFEITYANPAAAALPDGPSVGMDIRDLTGPLDPEENGREPRVLRRGKRSFPYRLTRIQDSGGQPLFVLTLLESEAHLRSQSELETAWKLSDDLKEILEGSFDGILVTDGEGNVQFMNSSYERVSAIPRQELEGRNMRALINPVWMENSVAFVVADERRAVSKRQVTRDGRDIIVTGMPVFDGDGNIKRIVINARDITEIYHLREELLNAKSRELQHYQSVLSTVNVDSEKMVAISESIKKVFLLAKRVGGFDTTVLILGESGAGKEEVARQIHRSSLRRDHALVTINCGAIPENLLESELFGYEKGAFTGASNAGKIGLLEAADGGTVFLDEVGELPLPFQVKLLRVLETKQVTRVGGIRAKPIDVRFIAATNRNLNKMVQDRTFREDLYYRLNVVSITVPPLRQRREDILPLSLYFLNMFNHRYNQNKVMTPEVIKRMEEYDWKGNVRELRNVVEHMVIMSPNTHLQISDVPWIIRQCGGRDAAEDPAVPAPESVTDLNLAVRQLEIRLLEQARKACGSTREMARYLHIDQSTVVRKLHKYGLTAT
ncbi:MAG: sigma 54-interacting transcriptional regulator [Oscillibacter sp.]|jgi:PAS domain S-box-containing protein|nr:sigma 54-interacting transcriptional regulator [uncultured Oscillibacter sp.]MCI8969838.1 sigma 54-interacting transcriptional regulator [Oscillibacter sp.]MCI9577672.1 sigma 54-interacting transcriptional regulator [Oscillibacter sp.]